MKTERKYRLLNENTLTVCWPDGISDQTFSEIQHFLHNIEQHQIPGLQTAYPAYNEVAVLFDKDHISYQRLIQKLEEIESSNILDTKTNKWLIPVCYEDRFAPDLQKLAKKLKLTPDEVVLKHSKPNYKVHFFGFQPGFMYLGGLDTKLHFARKNKPVSTKKGSVAIGGSQTGIYPQDSPGGWHVIGNCPLPFFNSNNHPPCFIEPGDIIRFNPVSYQEYKVIELEVRLDVFDYNQICRHG